MDSPNETTSDNAAPRLQEKEPNAPPPRKTWAIWTLCGEKYKVNLEHFRKGTHVYVFFAKHESTNVEYAIKVVRSPRRSMNEEMDIMSSLHSFQPSPNIVQFICYDQIQRYHPLGIVARYWAIVMERCTGDLTDAISLVFKTTGSFIPEINVRRQVLPPLLAAMEQLRRHNVVHLDIRPENFLWCSGVLKLTDFGAARRIDANQHLTLPPMSVDTTFYVPPESLVEPDGYYSIGNDVFGLGRTIMTLLTGQNGQPDTRSPKVAPVISSEMQTFLQALTHPNPNLRISFHEMLIQLELLQDLRPLKL